MHARTLRCWMFMLAAFLLPGLACAQQDGASAAEAARSGQYEDAIRIGEAALRSNPDDEVARRALTEALLDVGRYDEAAEAAASLANPRGEALLARGRLAEAEAAFREAAGSNGPDRLTAKYNLAALIFNRGDRAEAVPMFQEFIDVYNRGGELSSRDLTAVGNAVRYLGATEPALFQDAVMAYDAAIEADPTNIEPYLRLAELFLEKYNSTEAHTALDEAAAVNARDPRVLLGRARASSFDGDRGAALALVKESLEINPNLVAARVFLARMLLDTEDYEGAGTELERALDVDPASLDALSTLAALYFVQGDQSRYDDIRDEVTRLNPAYAGLLTTVADVAAQHRLYARAAELAGEAVRLDPTYWEGYGQLGLNQFRLGRIDEARESLERSFAGDPYNVWIKNNLDLLDTFNEYETVRLPGIELMLHEDEADVLLPYLEIAAEQAHADLSEQYGDIPRGPVRIELYPRSADFSVRTVGLAGLGALGVSFGDVVALDSPSAREAGTYNWVTTLWHELAHTAAMGISDNRVPRWLTEGLSVLAERRAQPGWEYPITPEFLIVYDNGELPPVSRLNEGFIRPPSPQHLAYAYDMASLVGLWIEETRGFDAVIEILHGYRDGKSTEEIFASVLRADPETVDEEFDAWLRQQASPDDAREFVRLFAEGREAFEAENFNEARAKLDAAAALFPIAGSGSPYALLARIDLSEGNDEAAIDALSKLTRFDENVYGANLELARLLEAAGDSVGSAAALDRAVWIYPFEPEPHQKLADLYTALGMTDGAVRERRAIVAMQTTDRASVLYELALALFNAGDLDRARTEVLRALETAPTYEPAQQLLLRLHEQQ